MGLKIVGGGLAGCEAAWQAAERGIEVDLYEMHLQQMTGALIHDVTHAEVEVFQSMKAVDGLLPKPEDDLRRSKEDRYSFYSERSLKDLENYFEQMG